MASWRKLATASNVKKKNAEIKVKRIFHPKINNRDRKNCKHIFFSVSRSSREPLFLFHSEFRWFVDEFAAGSAVVCYFFRGDFLKCLKLSMERFQFLTHDFPSKVTACVSLILFRIAAPDIDDTRAMRSSMDSPSLIIIFIFVLAHSIQRRIAEKIFKVNV